MDTLTSVSDKVERAGELLARAFVRGFRDLDNMGLCPICHDGYKLGGYSVLPCGHIMHLDCRFTYEHMSGAGHLTAYRSVLFAKLGLRGLYAFVCDRVEPLQAKAIWC